MALGKITIKRGKVSVTSKAQHAFLHGRNLLHTHQIKKGKVVTYVRHGKFKSTTGPARKR